MRLDIRATPQQKVRESINKSSMLKELLSLSPDDIDEWVDSNVTSLNDLKTILKEILKVVAYILHSKKAIRKKQDESDTRPNT